MREISDKQPTRLKNKRCAYCNAEFLRGDEPQEEHVIGRRFVPKGYHQQQWNLHLNACFKCNQTKCALENDISAIVMMWAAREIGDTDNYVLQEAGRKSKAKSARTGKRVADSAEYFQISGSLGPATVSFALRSLPQVDDERAFKLALFQLQGFHFFLTYDKDQKQGYHWQGVYAPLGLVNKSDWGNPLVAAFSELVAGWQIRLNLSAAQGFYRVLIKKHPIDSVWSWAIEWNKTFRLFGFYGDERAIDERFASLSRASDAMGMIPISPTLCYRSEVPVDASSDRFFEISDG